MDSDTKIGQVDAFIIKSTDPLGNDIETKIKQDSTKLFINPDATYSNVDTATRALIGLSSNTYQDTICVTNISVADVLAG